MRLVIMGPPGAGKGTQAALIKKEYEIPHISTGDMFREAISNQTALGIEAKKNIDKGMLVPDSVTISLVKERLSCEDCKKGFLLDGFPRTIAQAKALDDILKELNIKLDVVVNLIVSDDLIVSRIVNRRICPTCGKGYNLLTLKPKKEGICDVCGSTLYQRKDDNEETIKSRLNVYNEQTKPLIEYYTNNKLIMNLNGEGEAKEVTEYIIKELIKLYGNN